jgi:hypothetical protein
MKEAVRAFLNKIGKLGIELYLITIILLTLTDLFDMLPGEVDMAKKLFSWIVVILLVLNVSMSEIFFGIRKIWFDRQLVVVFSLLSLQSFIYYVFQVAAKLLHEPGYVSLHWLGYAIQFVGKYAIELVNWSKYVGFSWLLLLSLYAALRIAFAEKSVLGVLHEEGPPSKHIGKIMVRFLLTFIVLNGFSIFVFNLLLEWMGWAVDAPLLVIILAYYLFTYFRHYILTGRHFTLHMFLEQVENFGDEFTKKFITLFHYPQTFYIGFAGLLVFHMVTDIATFMVPYLTGTANAFYGSILTIEGSHAPIFFSSESWFTRDLLYVSTPYEAAIILGGYIANVIALLSLMLLPFYLWFNCYKGQPFKLGRPFLVLFSCCVTFFVLIPSFGFGPIMSVEEGVHIMGVDITTRSIMQNERAIITCLSGAFMIGLIVLISSTHRWLRSFIEKGVVIIVMLLFGYYTYFYFISIYHLALQEIRYLASQGLYYLMTILFSYLFLTFILYIAGYFVFVWLLRKQIFSDS